MPKAPFQSDPNETVLIHHWPDTGLEAHPDIYPTRFFAAEGTLREEVHKVGTTSEAKCDVHVNGRFAELDYTPYPDFNRAHGILLGVTKLTFADEARRAIIAATWKGVRRTPLAPPSQSSNHTASQVTGQRQYYRVMLGKRSMYANQCFAGGFIGADFDIKENLATQLDDDWRKFNKRFIPVYLEKHPGKSRIGAGLACGFLWTVSKGIQTGDIVLCPDGTGSYRVGEITGDYYYAETEILPHRRPVRWTDTRLSPEEMSVSLRNSARSIGTVSNLSRSGHHQELEKLVGNSTSSPVQEPPSVEDPTVFALEKHLQEFLVHNWKSTELGRRYDIFHDEDSDGEQVKADDGYIDILAISKDQKELLVVELKRGRASDIVVGQIQRYMGYVLDEMAEPHQTVRGVIIALEDDQRIRRALRVTQNIELFRYEVSFRLFNA